jgi:hypothetical protein
MGVLEIVIVSLLGLLLASTGWLVRISQILVGVLMNFGRSVLANFLEDTTKQLDTKTKSKRTLSNKGKKGRA